MAAWLSVAKRANHCPKLCDISVAEKGKHRWPAIRCAADGNAAKWFMECSPARNGMIVRVSLGVGDREVQDVVAGLTPPLRLTPPKVAESE
jgi:hypothetical protein